jgi:hypothetical protein
MQSEGTTESPVSNKTIRLVNNCAFPVWPAIVGSSDLPSSCIYNGLYILFLGD